MTLVVEGTVEFGKEVVEALERICPCAALTLVPDGRLTVGTPACACYCDHVAGCNLIAQLVDSGTTIWIKPSLGNSGYEEGGDNVVTWNPEDVLGGVDECGKEGSKPALLLAHELTHAWLELSGKDQKDEDLAVRGENQVRAELCEPLRVQYTSEENGSPVKDYEKPVIDTQDLKACACGMRQRGCAAWIRRWACRLLARLKCTWSQVWALFAPRPRPVRPPLDIPFAGYTDVRDRSITLRYRAALARRAEAVHREHVDGLRDRFDRARVGVHLEAVGVAGGYRVVWMIQTDEGTTIVTNLRPEGAPAGPYARGPGALVEYHVPPAPGLPAVADALARLAFASGAGGDTRAVDGMVHFLWVKRPGGELHAALSGYTFPAFHAAPAPPDGPDSARWQAVAAIHGSWRDMMERAGAGLELARPEG